MSDRLRTNEKHGVWLVEPPILAQVPGVRTASFNGKPTQIWPMDGNSARLLRANGVDAPSPLIYDYNWPGKQRPFDVQIETATFMVENRRGFILNDLGTGKTRSALYAIDYMIRRNAIYKTLLVVPTSTMWTVWADEIKENFSHLTYVVLHGEKKRRINKLRMGCHINIINHEGLRNMRSWLVQASFDCVVVDEIAAFRHQGTDKLKSMLDVVDGVPRVYGMTGTPIPNAPTDVWAQCRVVLPSNVPSAFKWFQEDLMLKVSNFKWVPKKGALDKAWTAMKPAIRYKREDCLDLPPSMTVQHHAQLTAEQQDAFNKMKAYCYLQLQDGEVSAVNEAIMVNKLLQITTGFVYGANKTWEFPCLPRVRLCAQLLAQAKTKGIVFVPYIKLVDWLANQLRKTGRSVATVSGATPAAQRPAIFRAFQRDAKPTVLVAHPKCMAHGLTLTAADMIVWFCPFFGLETYEQACGRITRPGQKHTAMIMQIEGSPLERKIYARLSQSKALQGTLLSMFED